MSNVIQFPTRGRSKQRTSQVPLPPPMLPPPPPGSDDYFSRMRRISESIDRINQMMTELRQQSERDGDGHDQG